MTHLLWICNNRTVWNKRTGQFIFQKIIKALGCHGTGRAKVILLITQLINAQGRIFFMEINKRTVWDY